MTRVVACDKCLLMASGDTGLSLVGHKHHCGGTWAVRGACNSHDDTIVATDEITELRAINKGLGGGVDGGLDLALLREIARLRNENAVMRDALRLLRAPPPLPSNDQRET